MRRLFGIEEETKTNNGRKQMNIKDIKLMEWWENLSVENKLKCIKFLKATDDILKQLKK